MNTRAALVTSFDHQASTTSSGIRAKNRNTTSSLAHLEIHSAIHVGVQYVWISSVDPSKMLDIPVISWIKYLARLLPYLTEDDEF
jgi:hypothetical protein